MYQQGDPVTVSRATLGGHTPIAEKEGRQGGVGEIARERKENERRRADDDSVYPPQKNEI